MTRFPLLLLLPLLLLALTGCNRAEKPVQLTDATVTVGCAMCQFEVEGAKGCFWAVDIGDTAYPVDGTLPHDHNSHAADGMCNMKRKAVVDGELKNGQFVATRFELVPAEGVPAAPAHPPGENH